MTMKTSERVQQQSHPRPDFESSECEGHFQHPTDSHLASPLYPLSAKEAIRVAVSSRAPVLITGERGTRKRGLARAIHREGLQKGTDLFVVKAERFQEEVLRLLEGGRELKGTLLIRGIDLLPAAMQAVLEDYLDGGELYLGGIARPAALRLIMTSEIDAVALATDSPLERTLLHRLRIVNLDLPPLRARRKDIPLIAKYVRDCICRNYSLPAKEISTDALDYLARYHWPDNLDELEGVIGRGLAVCAEEMIMPWHLSLSSEVEAPEIEDRDVTNPCEEEEGDQGEETPEVSSTTTQADSQADLSHSMALRLAHEIKNPLVSIMTYTNLLKDKFGDEEFRSEFYQVMRSDVEKIDRVVEEILTAARAKGEPMDEGMQEVVNVDVNGMIDELLAEFREKLAGRKIAVFRFLGDDIPAVPMQNAQSREALGGLLQSILDHISDNGDIYVSTGRKTLEGQDGKSGQAIEITLEGNPFEGDLTRLGADIVWQRKILKSQGGRVELRGLNGDGVAVTIMLPLSGG